MCTWFALLGGFAVLTRTLFLVKWFTIWLLDSHLESHHHIQDQQLPTMHHTTAGFLDIFELHIQSTSGEHLRMLSTAWTSCGEISYGHRCELCCSDTWFSQSCCWGESPGDWLSGSEHQHGGFVQWDNWLGPFCLSLREANDVDYQKGNGNMMARWLLLIFIITW